MPRICTVCAHPEHHAINVALVNRDPYRNITQRYGVSKYALTRHTKEHLPKLLLKAKDAVEVAEADDLLSRLEALQSRTLAVLEAVEGTENYSIALAAIREARSNLELIGRLTKELESAPTLNLYLNPQWLELRALIVRAIEPFPDARASILRALEGATNGSA
jgi:hypothetical protein